MRTAVVLHTSLNPCGGGERVCLRILTMLKRMGLRTVLATVEPTDWRRVGSMTGFGRQLVDEERSLLRFKLRAFGIYARLLSFLSAPRGDITINTHGDLMPVPADVTYMHFPTFTLAHLQPENQKYFSSAWWRIYFEPFRIAEELLAKRAAETILITNSRFSAAVIRKWLGARAIVIHPPVEVEELTPPAGSGERPLRVISIGRYNPEKNYEMVIELARRMKDVEFLIVGSAGEALARHYLARLRKLTEGVRNVRLLVDVPRSELRKLLWGSRVYLHCMKFEHFGIAPVEAMAAGCVPVVHASGGTWTDVLEFGRYGYGYRDIDEAEKAIRKALDEQPKRWRDMVRAAQRFSPRRFDRAMEAVIRKCLGLLK